MRLSVCFHFTALADQGNHSLSRLSAKPLRVPKLASASPAVCVDESKGAGPDPAGVGNDRKGAHDLPSHQTNERLLWGLKAAVREVYDNS